ncbi:MAG TPA: hypothetical protein VIH57_00485 [Bacteroidales bacterium]
MKVFGVYFILAIIINQPIKAQAKNEKFEPSDTIHENVLYEYDTVYVAPDTLKLTDTIIHYKPNPNPNQIKPSHSSTFFDKINILNNMSDKWTVGIGLGSFVSGLFEKGNVVDSFSTKRTINYIFDIHISYQLNRFKYTVGVGFSPIHERLWFAADRFSITSLTGSGSYDSIRVKKDCVSDNYFNYVNVFFSMSHRWGNVKQKVYVGVNTFISEDFLINYNAVLPADQVIKIKDSSVRKAGTRIGVFPCVGFRSKKNLNFAVGPFCWYSLVDNHKYPFSDRLVLGIEFKIQ